MRLSGKFGDPGHLPLAALTQEQRKGIRLFLDGREVDKNRFCPCMADDSEGVIEVHVYDDERSRNGYLRSFKHDGENVLVETLRGEVRIEIPPA